MDSKCLLKFIGCFPDYLSALSRTLLNILGTQWRAQHQIIISQTKVINAIAHTLTVMIRTTFFIPVNIDTISTCAGKPAYSTATYLGTVEPKGRVHVAMWQHVHCSYLYFSVLAFLIGVLFSLLQYRIRLGWPKSTECFHSLLGNWL